MSVPFKGTLKQCLDRLRQLPKQNIERFIAFTQAEKKTVWGWLMDDQSQPAGIFWVRAACFFRLNGWSVAELDANDPLAVTLAELWSYSVISPEEIKEFLGYETPSNQGLLEIVYGQRKFMLAQKKLMSQLAKLQAEALEARRQELAPKYAIEFDGDETVGVPQRSDPVALLANLLKEALPLVKAINSDEFSDSDRARLRKLVGQGEYPELAVELSQMKSADTRKRAKAGGVR